MVKMENEVKVLNLSSKINRNHSDINRKMVTKYIEINQKQDFIKREK